MPPKAQYDSKTDAVIYGSSLTSDFTREDWIRLALAALDQAGLDKVTQDMITASIEAWALWQATRRPHHG